MSLDGEDLKSVRDLIEKALIANNAADHKLDTIAERAKYDDTVTTLKTDFQRYFFKGEGYKAFNEGCARSYIAQRRKLFVNQDQRQHTKVKKEMTEDGLGDINAASDTERRVMTPKVKAGSATDISMSGVSAGSNPSVSHAFPLLHL